MKRFFHTFATLLPLMALLATACEKDPVPIIPAQPEQPEQPEQITTIAPGADGSLGGTLIGTRYSVDYSNNNAQSETVNSKANVFDRDFSTFFASYDRSGTWVGLDLGKKYVINKIGYAPRKDFGKRVELAVIEGANKADFSDAMPIYLIPEAASDGKMTYADVSCSRGFRYVRYVTPNDVRCNLAELAFYGTEGEGDDSKLYQVTNLPLVVINTEGSAEIVSKEEEINSTVYVIGKDGTYLHTDTETGVRGRGNASWGFPKKPYRLKFDKKVALLDAPSEAKKWTLINNYGDKTLMRNILAFEISRRIGLSYTPYCQPVDVILNGEYRGCYQLCDQIEVREGRVDITEMEPEDNEGEALTGGYLIEIDAYASSEASHFYSKRGTPVTIKSPDDDKITKEQSDYIEDYFNKMEAAVFSQMFDDPENGYRKYLDLDSFLRHFLVGELSGNTDTYWSVYMAKERGSDRFITGPVWDFDIAFDNDNRTYPINLINDYVYAYAASRNHSIAGKFDQTVDQIVKKDVGAKARLAEMWSELRNSGAISEESLKAYIAETVELLDQSQKLNFKRWPILNSKVHMNPQALGSYPAEVGTINLFITDRISFMDKAILGE